MKKIRRSKSGFTLVELMVVITIIGILAAVGTPAMMIALDRAKKNADTQNIRQLGMVLTAVASDSGDERFPSLTDAGVAAATSTDVFNTLYLTRAIRSVDLVFAPGRGKTKAVATSPTTPPFAANNVGYCYTTTDVAATPGVPLGDDDYVPLLYNSGNSTPVLTSNGAKDLTLQDTGIWGKSAINVYYKNNTARIMSPKGSNGVVKDFVPASFIAPTGYGYSELAP